MHFSNRENRSIWVKILEETGERFIKFFCCSVPLKDICSWLVVSRHDFSPQYSAKAVSGWARVNPAGKEMSTLLPFFQG